MSKQKLQIFRLLDVLPIIIYSNIFWDNKNLFFLLLRIFALIRVHRNIYKGDK